MSNTLTLADVAEHNSKKSLYLVIHDKVYNITKFIDEVSGPANEAQDQTDGRTITGSFPSALLVASQLASWWRGSSPWRGRQRCHWGLWGCRPLWRGSWAHQDPLRRRFEAWCKWFHVVGRDASDEICVAIHIQNHCRKLVLADGSLRTNCDFHHWRSFLFLWNRANQPISTTRSPLRSQIRLRRTREGVLRQTVLRRVDGFIALSALVFTRIPKPSS